MRKINSIKPKLIVTFGILVYAVVLYVLPVSCIFKEIFGFKCPGCGMTRALLAVLHADFKAAFGFHWMVWSLPVLYLCFLYDGRLFDSKLMNVLLYAAVSMGFIANWLFNTNI